MVTTKVERNTLIKWVHIAKRDLGLDDDMYRKVLTEITGKTSCSDMNVQQLKTLIEDFKQRGWRKKPQKRYSPKTSNKNNHDMVDKVRAMWIDMHKVGMTEDGTEAALDSWVKRTTTSLNSGKGIERVEWLRGAPTGLVIKTLEALKQWQKRVNNQWMQEDLRIVFLECERTGQSQEEVIKQLLSAKAIMWWPLFEKIGIEPSDTYCINRKQLNR